MILNFTQPPQVYEITTIIVMCMTINHFEFKIIFSPEHIAITAPISSLSTNFDNKVTIGVLVRPPE